MLNMECALCDSIMNEEKRELEIKRDGYTLKLSGITAYVCPNCGNIEYMAKDIKMAEKLCMTLSQANIDLKEEYLNVTDIQLFVSYSSTVGYRARDDRWSNKIEYSGDAFNELLGQPVQISSIGNIPSGRKVFIRAAARINYDTPVGSGTRRWNYSEPVEVLIP